MYEFRSLLDRFWVTKAEDKELYYTLKRTQPEYKRFLNEQLGWNLIVNESVIKLEKVPPKAMPWMGIQEFSDNMDYCLLCALLLYLSDLDDEEQFLLSSLTEAVETFSKDFISVDWTRFTHRKSMVRVLRYAQNVGLILVYDGSSESFSNNPEQEVLYENTGFTMSISTREILLRTCALTGALRDISQSGEHTVIVSARVGTGEKLVAYEGILIGK